MGLIFALIFTLKFHRSVETCSYPSPRLSPHRGSIRGGLWIVSSPELGNRVSFPVWWCAPIWNELGSHRVSSYFSLSNFAFHHRGQSILFTSPPAFLRDGNTEEMKRSEMLIIFVFVTEKRLKKHMYM